MIMKRTYENRPDSEITCTSEKDGSFSFLKLSTCGSTNCSEGHDDTFDAEVSKRTYSESDADSEDSSADEVTSENISCHRFSNQKKIKKLKHERYRDDISKKMNDSGFHNTSLGICEMNSDIYQRLMQFSQRDLSDIITTLLQPDFELNVVLDQIKSNTACLLIFMKIISLVCKSNSGLKIEILLNVSKSSLLDSIRCILRKIIDDPNPTWSTAAIVTFFAHAIEFYSSVFILLPEMIADLNLREIVDATLKACAKFENCDSDTSLLRFKLNDLLTKIDSYPIKHFPRIKLVADLHTYSLYPSCEDLMSPTVFDVEPALVRGMYVDLDHYLSVHFCLLRECFHRPIRTAVQSYLHGGDKILGVDFWANVVFRRVTFCNKTMCFEATFDNLAKSSSYLVYGSLVIFSNDNFHTFFFGVVEEWNGDAASVMISLLMDQVNTNIDAVFDSSFIMIDASISLPRYNYPVLMEALLSKHTRGFPLVKYLINAELDSQSFLPVDRKRRLNAVFNLDSEDKLMKFVDVTLDIYQFSALKSALTDPVTLVAGSRGTGKTLLAGKILQVLLHGRDMKSTVKRFPILMICRSDDALDEFLCVARNSTRKMVRMGGKTSNTRLRGYNLRELRRRDIGVALQKVTLSNLQRQIKSIADDIRTLNECAGILSFNLLKSVMVERHRRNLDEERLMALLVDDDGFIFDYAESVGTIEERLEATISAEIDESRAFGKYECIDNANTRLLNSSSTSCNNVFADEFFVDEFVDSYDPVVADDKSASRIAYATTIETCSDLYQKKVEDLELEVRKLKTNSQINGEIYFAVEHVQMLRRRLTILKTELKNLSLASKIGLSQETCSTFQQKDFDLLNLKERWMMYEFWVCKLKNSYLNQFYELVKKFEEESRNLDKTLDLEILSHAEVVGTTTTCMKKFQLYFKHFQPSIVIVEEATEIIEAEIVVPLSEVCDQLILFGDLHTMKASTPNPKFSKKHLMDVSLFERLLNNGFRCHHLKIQRLVPTEINSLLRSVFVIDLYSNNGVNQPKVEGFNQNVFFFTTNSAQKNGDVSVANFVVKMCWYLMKQNVAASEISVLSVDAEQAYYLKQALTGASNSLLKLIQVATVDNFRSKTNKIILLSLVDGGSKITDANDKKRVLYTAFTRSTQALFMFGDVDHLSRDFLQWSSIHESLEKWNACGTKIILSCGKHRKFGSVSVTENFWSGCGEICGDVLSCNHSCPFPCHLEDTEHIKKYICHAKTPTRCNSGHEYEKKCGSSYQACPVEITIPSRYCGHSVTKKCGEFVYSMNCSQICNQLLPCGHKCPERCHRLTDPTHKKVRCKAPCGKIHADCTRGHVCTKLCSERCGICFETDPRVLECGHKTRVMCSFDASRVKCYEKCFKICAVCGERCQKYCFEDCQPCTNKVLKIIEDCGHEKLIECGILPENNLCDEWVTRSSVTMLCGHNQLNVPCPLRNEDPMKLSSYCRHPCDTMLMCGHLCSGTCGSCFQQRIHVGCSGICDRIFVCGHRCESSCEEVHQPCTKVCTYFCQHQKCNAECGLPCVPCKAICEWKCKHMACSRTCSEFCDRIACFEPCDQNLPCGHLCIGFCGEPCPPLCRICDSKLLAINHPDAVNNPRTRFVLLVDCLHVVESRSLEEYLYSNRLVSLKKCPYSSCQKTIFSTLRYRNQIKQYFQHVKNIKKMYLRADDSIHGLIEEIDQKMYDVWILFYLTDANLAVNDVERVFHYYAYKRENRLPELTLLQSLNYFADLMLDIGSRYSSFSSAKFSKSFPESLGIAEDVRQCVANIMLKLQVPKISIQLVDDLHCEVNRFHKMIDFCLALVTKLAAVAEARQIISTFQDIFRAPGKYDDERDNRVNDLMREMQTTLQLSIPVSSFMPKNVHLTQTIKSKLLNEKRGFWYVCQVGHYYRSTEHHDWSSIAACPFCGPSDTDGVSVSEEKDLDSSHSVIVSSNAVCQ